MKVDVLNISGGVAKSVDLPEDIFGIEPNEHAVYLAVKQYRANQRQGTHKAKEKGEITGSTRKIKKQKGTGTARAGSIKSGVFRGGGRMFGPKPRNYRLKLNKKVKRLARASAFSAKAKDGQLVVVENFTFDQPKTKEFNNVLENLNIADKKSLLVVGEMDKNLYLSGRNCVKSGVVIAENMSTYEILNAHTIVLSEGAVNKITETFA